MNKDFNAGESDAKAGSERRNSSESAQQKKAVPVTDAANARRQFQQESRSDQEQEGTQNPAADTRDVSRDPVDQADGSIKK